MSRVFVDTNVFVYLFDTDAPAKQARARALLASHATSIVVSTQVLQEFYVAVTRKLAAPLPSREAEAAVTDLAAFEVVVPDVELMLRAVARSRASSLSLWDTLILETALEAGCERLLTEDLQAGRTFGALTVENPFQ